MFFHIDESGNTGNNLFDADQPRLSYGLLSSPTNADALCGPIHRKIQKKIGADQIHANVLGVGGLTEIVPELMQIQSKMGFNFDYYFVEKPAYALVSFFEAVFDAGINKAVKWEWYWTPLRFILIYKLTVLFDEELLRRSWRLCTTRRIQKNEGEIVALLSELRTRASASGLDPRSIEVISDALSYGIENPLALDFGHPDELLVSPNAVGFQFVVSAIARRVRKKKRKKAASILVDRQTQFNDAQIETHRILGAFSRGFQDSPEDQKRYYLRHPMFITLDPEDIVHKDLPDTGIRISSSVDSIGLQIVDVYLWLANRLIDRSEISHELVALWRTFTRNSLIDGISFEGMKQRFLRFERLLPSFEDLTEEQLEFSRASVEKHRAKVKTLGL